MSHELRTPLTSILGFAQLMKTDADFPERLRPMLGVLHRSGHHLLELIDDVLEMSRVEAGKLAKNPASFDLQGFLADLLDLMRARAEQKDLVLVLRSDPGLPVHVKTDGRKLRQILINLLGNAIKYTAEGQVVLKVGFTPAEERREGALRPVWNLKWRIRGSGLRREIWRRSPIPSCS
jgi:two-component system, sensor histidine kinase and response regulator